MKVLFVFGGIPHYLDSLLASIAAKDVDVAALVPSGRSGTVGDGVKMSETAGGYRVVRSAEKTSRFTGKAFFPSLRGILEEEAPDILVIGWPYFLQLFFQRGILRTLKEKSIRLMLREIPFHTPPYMKLRRYFREHPAFDENMNLLSRGAGFYVKNFLLMFVRRFLYRRADGALAYSTAAYDILPGYGIGSDRIFVTYNSPDTRAIEEGIAAAAERERLLPECRRRIIHVGRLVRWKRVDLLIRSFARVAPLCPDSELVIVGDGPEFAELKRLAAESGAGERIRFTGAVYDPVLLAGYMRESSVYVLAGMGGLSINDAMACGLPVVCSVCDGTERDLVEEGVSGLFFKEGDGDSLAEKILLLFSSEEMTVQMGRSARKTILEKINMETVSSRYVEAFKTVLR